MAVNFPQEKQTLLDILNNNVESESETEPNITTVARQITGWYDDLVKTGQDLVYGNAIIQANPQALQSALQTAFTAASQNPTEAAYQTISTGFQTGIIAYWTGAQLEFSVPPPPSIQVTQNVITNPGTFQYTLPQESSSVSLFIDGLLQSIQAHFQTVSGITTSLTPQPSGPPVPVPYSFTGYF